MPPPPVSAGLMPTPSSVIPSFTSIRNSVCSTVLPSHLDKDQNPTLKDSVVIWRPEKPDHMSKILALVPFFNETPEELYKTLHSMYKTYNHVISKKSGVLKNRRANMTTDPSGLHVLIVQDGYRKACKEMNLWLEENFPGEAWKYLANLKDTVGGVAQEDKDTISWFCRKTSRHFKKRPSKHPVFGTRECKCCGNINSKEHKEFCSYCGLQLGPDPLKEAAVVFQIVDDNMEVVPAVLKHPTEEGRYIKMTVTLIVKCRNRQKHDSHWWGLSSDNGFMKAYPRAEFGWLTDCGTLFHYKCLYHLLMAVARPNVAAATGRQRVMSPSHQDAESEGLVSRFLRHVQRADFELSFGATMGSFAMFGFLPVLPGPCGFYRLPYLLACAPFYHDFLSMEVKDIGVIDANLMIAEDRVLSWAVFFESTVTDERSKSCLSYYESLDYCCWDGKDAVLDDDDVGPSFIVSKKNKNGTVSEVPNGASSSTAGLRSTSPSPDPFQSDSSDDSLELPNLAAQEERRLRSSGRHKVRTNKSPRVHKAPLEAVKEKNSQPVTEGVVTIDESPITAQVRTVLSPEAIFYFECEPGILSFIKQRRRWLNGTFCGYLWLLYKRPFYPISNAHVKVPQLDSSKSERQNLSESDTEEARSSRKTVKFNVDGVPIPDKPKVGTENVTYRWRLPWYRLWPINFLVFIQVWMNFCVLLGPAIFISMFRYSLSILAFSENIYSTYWWIGILLLYYLFVVGSMATHIQSWMFYIAALFGMVIEGLSLAGIGLSSYRYFTQLTNNTAPADLNYTLYANGTAPPTNESVQLDWVVLVPLAMVVFIMFLPVVSSCLACPKLITKFFRSSFWFIITSGLPYFLFLPTLVATFGAFACARLFDFTWGNRDSAGSTDKLGSRLEELQQRAKFISPLFVLINTGLVFILADLSEISGYVLLIFSILLFGPALIHFFLSFSYFLWWRLTKPCNDCCYC